MSNRRGGKLTSVTGSIPSFVEYAPGKFVALGWGATTLDVQVGWSTEWICSSVVYLGLIWICGPIGTSPRDNAAAAQHGARR